MSAQLALAYSCRVVVLDVATLLMLRLVAREAKASADDALGRALGRRGWAFRPGAGDPAGDPAAECARLRRKKDMRVPSTTCRRPRRRSRR